MKLPPHSDYIHFYAHFQPWSAFADQNITTIIDKSHAKNAGHCWYVILRQLNELLNIGIPMDNEDDWREYAKVFQQAPIKENRVMSLPDLAKLSFS